VFRGNGSPISALLGRESAAAVASFMALATFDDSIATGAGRGISTGREGPVAPVPEPVLSFRD